MLAVIKNLLTTSSNIILVLKQISTSDSNSKAASEAADWDSSTKALSSCVVGGAIAVDVVLVLVIQWFMILLNGISINSIGDSVVADSAADKEGWGIVLIAGVNSYHCC